MQAITATSYYERVQKSLADIKEDLIQKNTTSIQELEAGALMITLVLPFIATPLGAVLITTNLIAVIATNFFVGALKEVLPSTNKFYSNWISQYQALNFSRFYFCTLDTLIHEGGHTLVANALYCNANPVIQIQPNGQGLTTYKISQLSKLGAYFGKHNSSLIVAAAGVTFTLGASLIYFITAHQTTENHPDLARHLNWMGLTSTYKSISYALSAFSADKTHLSHDFVKLWVQGWIHPYFFVACLVLIPLITKILLYLKDREVKI